MKFGDWHHIKDWLPVGALAIILELGAFFRLTPLVIFFGVLFLLWQIFRKDLPERKILFSLPLFLGFASFYWASPFLSQIFILGLTFATVEISRPLASLLREATLFFLFFLVSLNFYVFLFALPPAFTILLFALAFIFTYVLAEAHLEIALAPNSHLVFSSLISTALLMEALFVLSFLPQGHIALSSAMIVFYFFLIRSEKTFDLLRVERKRFFLELAGGTALFFFILFSSGIRPR